jgi:hypothetical protein
MRLSLARAKEVFQRKAPVDELEYRLNRVCERFILSGKFLGTMARLQLAAPYGQVALPRGFRTLEGVKVNGTVRDLANRWFDFLPGKRAFFTGNGPYEIVDDLGDGHAIMYSPALLPLLPTQTPPDSTLPTYDFPAGQGTIQATYTGNPITITISGYDNNEMPVQLVLVDQTAQTNPFARISEIHKEQNVSVLIQYTAPDPDNRVTTLARMEPNEEETYYRRYFVSTQQSKADVAIEGFCKRRHIEFTSDKDILPFSNISALEKGLDAYQYESEGDETQADKLWAKGIKLLNDELGDAHAPDEMPMLRIHGLHPIQSHF